ncbi:MAG: NAD(P)-binding protein [Candidatus Micrarchaeaceae archaeon]
MKLQISDHAIVCGYGIVGEKVVESLLNKGVKFVIIENDAQKVEKIKELGYNVVNGDATTSRALKEASIETAKAVAVAMDNDAKDLFAVLTARDLNQKAFIATRASDQFVKEKLIEAGADYVVLPQKSASKEILDEILKK